MIYVRVVAMISCIISALAITPYMWWYHGGVSALLALLALLITAALVAPSDVAVLDAIGE